MKQVITKYFLFLSILLLSGGGHLFAQSPKESSAFVPAKENRGLSQSAVSFKLAAVQHVARPTAEASQSKFYISESETEEDEALLIQDLSENPILASVPFAHVLALLLGMVLVILLIREYLPYFSSFKLYLIFGVLQI